jgi:hypothetical protein
MSLHPDDVGGQARIEYEHQFYLSYSINGEYIIRDERFYSAADWSIERADINKFPKTVDEVYQ